MKILESDLRQTEQARMGWTLMLSEGATLETALDPATYANVVRKLNRGDVIEVLAHDGTWEASIRVRAVVGLDVRFGLRHMTRYPETSAALDPGEYLVEASGKAGRWRVVRLSDRKVMVADLTSEAAGYHWLEHPPAAEALRAAA